MQELFSFYVNNELRGTAEEKSLLRYLRDDLRLTSVKDGCSEGACGTCMILADGKATRACLLTTAKAAGKHILTVEGLPEEEKEIYVQAFGRAGAVQCGFCTPGMVISAKALLDANPDPTVEEVKKAIRGNLCRCTGYKKIIDGILLAGEMLRAARVARPQAGPGTPPGAPSATRPKPARHQLAEARCVSAGLGHVLDKGLPKESPSHPADAPHPPASDYTVGSSAFRVDVRDKVLGTGEYVDDIEMEDMLHASALRTPHPRALVKKIDAEAARALPGVRAVLTAADVPNNKVGHIQQDWDVMIAEGDITRCVGDAICLVVAESREICEEAKAAVNVEYEVLEPVRNIHEARKEDAPAIHAGGNLCQSRHVTRGDAAGALAASKYTVTQTYSTPFTEHAFMEPECALAFPYKDGVKVLTSDQGVYDTRKEIAIMLGWDQERIVVENKLIGGGFGGKEDVSVQHLAALAALKVGKPVKIKLSRQESINFHPKRHAMEATFTLGCDENGIFTGLDCEIFFDTGAYASLCGPVLERACTHSVGPYKYQNTDIRGYGYYTNNPPAGAFRGFGVCQSEFALERNIDLLAEKVGISPWEIRFRNAIEPGLPLPNGQIADSSTALKETLLAVKDVYEKNAGRAGIACAMKNSGVGVGLPDKGRAKLRVEDGMVVLYTAASDIGQGSDTIMLQMLATSTGLPAELLRFGKGGSETMPDSGTTSGSRHTLITGEAVRMAGAQLREAMEQAGITPPPGTHATQARSRYPRLAAAHKPREGQAPARQVPAGSEYLLARGCPEAARSPLAPLEGREFFAEFFDPTDKLGADLPNPKSHIAYAYATNVAVVDDAGLVTDIYAAHDSGKVVNPISIQGQIEGGVLMSMGYALTEDFPLEDCVPKARLGTLGLFRADRIPEIHAIYVESEGKIPFAYGSKGIGEIASIPAAPAIAGAYYALDGKFRTKLPLDDTLYRGRKKDAVPAVTAENLTNAAVPSVTKGETMSYLGEEIKKLGFGLMRLPKTENDDKVIDVEHTKKMVDAFLEAGFSYFDTAWAYDGSEEAIRQALVERHPRESYQLATKMAAWIKCETREEAIAQFETSLEKTGAGYFDFYLLHNLGEDRTQYFDKFDLWNWAKEIKEKGLAKHIGFSFHSTPEELEEILAAHPEMEFVQLQINYADWESPAIQSRACYEVARKHNIPVIIMEPVKGGMLATPPPAVEKIFKEADPEASNASWALRFAANLPGVITVLSGMSNMEQMEDNLAVMKDFNGLTDEQNAVLTAAREELAKIPLIPCTVCNYCAKVCPMDIGISGSFTAMNSYTLYNDLEKAQSDEKWLVGGHNKKKAAECVQCGLCEEACPQHIQIRDELVKVAETLG